MPKIGKAARGKHRWIGLEFNSKYSDYKSFKGELEKILNIPKLKIYDFIVEDACGSCIIKVTLADYFGVRSRLEGSDQEIFSVTSSGKIKLVRLRLDSHFQR